MDSRDLQIDQGSARDLLADLLDLTAQLRVDSEQEQRKLSRDASTAEGRAECRGYVRALTGVMARLDRAILRQLPEQQRPLVRYRVEAEASRRLAAAPQADEAES